MGKIIQAWQQTPDGNGVSFSQSYGASTDQARAVANGLKADIVFLSTGDDVNLLVDAGLVDSKWNQSYDGIAADTVVVFAVRNGNPKHIKGWNDLIKPGVQVDDAEPVQLRLGEVEHPGRLRRPAPARQDRQAGDRVRAAALQARRLAGHLRPQRDEHVPRPARATSCSPTRARRSLARNGQDIQYVIPRQSMLIELPIAVLKSSSNKDKANKFIRFVKGTTAQDLFAQYGFRPVDQKVAEEVRVEVPGPARHLQGRRQDHRRLAERRQGLVRPEQGPDGEDRAGGRRADSG